MTTFTVTDDVIDEMVRRIVDRFHPEQIILFGSRARGDHRPDSDVDLLVVLPEIEEKHKATVEILGILGDAPRAKDVIVTTREEICRRGNVLGSVLRPALREGVIIYSRIDEEGSLMDENPPNEAWSWLEHARGDLDAAEQGFDILAPRHICWLAQQAAEKALKAALIAVGIEPPREHDLKKVLRLLPDDWRIHSEQLNLDDLTRSAVQSRYPDRRDQPTEDDARESVKQARVVLDSLIREFEQRGIPTQEEDDEDATEGDTPPPTE